MGRPRKAENQYLPENLRYKSVTRKSGKTVIYWFYRTTGKTEISLGTDRNTAFIKAAQMNLERDSKSSGVTFSAVAKRYKSEIITEKKHSTQKANLMQLKNLLAFFASAPLDEIEPSHIQEYMQRRKHVQGIANNELALFHHIWKYARIWGYTKLPSPSEGVPKFPIKKRDVYIENHIYQMVYDEADQTIRDLMDLAYLTGQRPVDLVNIQREHIFDGYLHIVQQKTQAKLRIQLVGKLAEIINRLVNSTDKDFFFYTKKGERLDQYKLGKRFNIIRRHAANKNPDYAEQICKFQFRDLRAKSGTDKAMQQGEDAARQQLGHTTVQMTKTYIRKAPIIPPLSILPTDQIEGE